MPPAATEARFPHVHEGRGHYESFYLRAVDPGRPRGAWIRYTIHTRPGQAPGGSIWFTLFDGEAAGPVASKVTLGPDELSAGDGSLVRIGDSAFQPGHVTGSAKTEQADASWQLSFDGAPPLRHLPRAWMYRTPIPRTKLESPSPAATFQGELHVDGRRIAVDGWRGMIGHNWGSQHAERWIWMHGVDLDPPGGAWVDVAIGRVKVGPLTTPWIANGAVWLADRQLRVGGPAARGTEVHESPYRCDFVLPGGEAESRGHVAAPVKDFVGWVYADPDGSEHNTVNCSIAEMRVTVTQGGKHAAELGTDHGAAYELGMRETDHGVPIQPFPDG